MEAEFRLMNDLPKHKPAEFANSDRKRQRVLLAGLDCLAGQRDLFKTDGECDTEPATVQR